MTDEMPDFLGEIRTMFCC